MKARVKQRETPVSRAFTRKGVSSAVCLPLPPSAGKIIAESGTLVLVLPLPDNRANDRKHWRTAHRDKVAFWDACALMRNPRPPAQPLDRVTLAYHLTHGGQAMDWDNLAARLKHLQDWLVQAKYLRDDSPKVIRGTPTLTQTPNRRASEHCVVVTITPLTEDPA